MAACNCRTKNRVYKNRGFVFLTSLRRLSAKDLFPRREVVRNDTESTYQKNKQPLNYRLNTREKTQRRIRKYEYTFYELLPRASNTILYTANRRKKIFFFKNIIFSYAS